MEHKRRVEEEKFFETTQETTDPVANKKVKLDHNYSNGSERPQNDEEMKNKFMETTELKTDPVVNNKVKLDHNYSNGNERLQIQQEDEEMKNKSLETIELKTAPAVNKHTKPEHIPSNNNELLQIQEDIEATPSSRNKTNGLISNMAKRNLEILQSKSNKNKFSLNTESKKKFIYGNYKHYYGYRNKDKDNNKDFHDIRLDVLKQYESLFHDKDVLDIGCNNGQITIEMAKMFNLKSIIGLDIDRSLINQAKKHLLKYRKTHNAPADLVTIRKEFPFNITFVYGNYVLRDDVLLEIERPQFDIILCLSITKWIHLNFADDGLKRAFRRMYLQLRPNGHLILEPQPFDNYRRRRNLTPIIATNYKNIKFRPANFEAYLLSPEVGFKSMEVMGIPEHCKAGFKRPIYLYHK